MATKKKKAKTSGPKKKIAPKPIAKKKKTAAKKKVVAKKAPKRKPVAKKKPRVIKKKAVAKVATKKPAAKKTGAKKTKKTIKQPLSRRDGTGHINPLYAEQLRSQSARPQPEPRAFFAGSRTNDDLAEQLGEEVIAKATSGEDDGEDRHEQVVDEESGGPFVESPARKEFAFDTDESNPVGAFREPFPTV